MHSGFACMQMPMRAFAPSAALSDVRWQVQPLTTFSPGGLKQMNPNVQRRFSVTEPWPWGNTKLLNLLIFLCV